MDNLTLEHLAPYLPYGIQIIDNGEVETIIGVINNKVFIEDCHRNGYASIEDVKLVLRPMTDLIKEVWIKGHLTPLVDIVITTNGTNTIVDKMHISDDYIYCNYRNYPNDTYYKSLVYHIDNRMFTLHRHSSLEPTLDNARVPYFDHNEIFQKLLSWHFDVFGLIEKGLAIDINSIEGKETNS